MMKSGMIEVINPNGSAEMTQSLADSLNHNANTESLRFHYCKDSPPSIEGFSDGSKAAYHLTELVTQLESEGSSAKGYVVACFDDTGVDAAREISSKPVVGIGETAMKCATYLGNSFVVMTTLQRSVPIIKRNIANYGLDAHCAAVIASNIPVLSLDSDPEAYERILEKAQTALSQFHGEVLILGCAGMSHWQKKLQEELGVPVIDGMQAAIAMVGALSGIGLSTSKVCSYALPEKKTTG